MKSQYCKKNGIYDIGFIDPYYIHEKTVKNPKTRKTTEDCLYDALLFNQTKREILFPYNFEWVLLSLYTFFFAYWFDVKCVIDELCLRRHHFILLVIHPDKARVQVMDSLRRDLDKWANLQKLLQK
jgi:hypothetical protein